jgi:hypothetical protein
VLREQENPLAKQDIRQKSLRKGLEVLRSEGIPVEDPSPTVVEALKRNFGKVKEVDLALVYLLGRITDPSALDALVSLEPGAANKDVKREVRRSLFKLAQKGLLPPRSESDGEEREKPDFSLGPGIEAYLSSVDSAGNRLIWLAKPQAGSGIQIIQGFFNDGEGLVQVAGSLIRRKELRQMISEIKEKHGISMISIPWDYADFILYEAFEKAKALGRSGLEQFHTLRAHLNLAKPSPRAHPVNPDEIRSGSWRETSQRLLEEPEFQTWVLVEDWVRPYMDRVQEAQASRLVLNPMQKEERMSTIVRQLVQEVFEGEVGQQFAGRMEDMALHLFLANKEDRAKSALAVALSLKEGELGGLGVPFLHGLVQKSFAYYMTQDKRKPEDSSLIVKP